MRERPGVYTYIYPGPKNFQSPDSSAARGAVCEHALALLGAVPDRDIDAAVDLFMEFREDLRLPVKVWGPSWLPPRAYTSYFYFFAYDHAARAIAHRGEHAAERLGRLRDDVLRVAEVGRHMARLRTDRQALRHGHGAAHPLPRAGPGVEIAPRRDRA